MSSMPEVIVVIGATGTIGRAVVDELRSRGIAVRALTRDAARAARVLGESADVDIVAGDVTNPDGLRPALEGAGGVILTHGGDSDPERVYVGAVRALVQAAGDRRLPVALMSSINVEDVAPGPYAALLSAKKRGEDVLRGSGLPYTVVRPGWFGATDAGDNRVVLRQGDRVAHGGVRVNHVAQVLVEALLSRSAKGRTVEVFSGPGDPVADWEAAFATARADSQE
ncbi:MAG: SDR family NAD(P)-dependent oxidoreductase [Actinomycetaceae bacterium]|nr:SDR family NAD(P)-dependent oxidoreductase [Actinomycetaceae bacterium]